MKNYKQKGETVELTAPSGGVVSGSPLMIGNLLVVPHVTAAQTESFNALTEGVIEGVKTTGVAITEGAAAYWNASTNKFTPTKATGLFLAGVFLKAEISAAATCLVKLSGRATFAEA